MSSVDCCESVHSSVGSSNSMALSPPAERQVQIVRELEDLRVRENENAVFMCEVSLEEVKGEWSRDGEKIKVTSTVKIRQEGKCSKGLPEQLAGQVWLS